MALDQIVQGFAAILLLLVLFDWVDLVGALILILGAAFAVRPFGPLDAAWG